MIVFSEVFYIDSQSIYCICVNRSLGGQSLDKAKNVDDYLDCLYGYGSETVTSLIVHGRDNASYHKQ